MWRSAGLTRILGWQIDEVAPTVEGWTALQHPMDRERLKTQQDPGFLQENDNYVMEYRVKHKVGFYVWVLDSGRVFRDTSGAIIRRAGVIIDISARKKVAEFRDVYPVSLGGMELAESIEFLRSEAAERGEAGRIIREANESLLERIYLTTGGLPLAMRLVLGQTTRSSPKTVLKHLEAVNYQKIQNPESDEDVYNQFFKFIYWDSWNQLSDFGKQLLIELGAFDPIEGARRDFLSAISELSSTELDDVASELVEFSLVRRSFEDDQEIFYLHPLTHHFVQHDV